MSNILATLADCRSFICWRYEPRPGEPKPAKVPVDPRTGYRINWMDPATWMLPNEALTFCQAQPGLGLGICLWPGCNLLGLDLDNARDPAGGWLPHVRWFEDQFPGAYWETSPSGTGRRGIVRAQSALLPAHGCRWDECRAEAYSQARFLTLTGVGASGGLETDHTAVAQRFLAAHFPPTDVDHGGEWRDGPVATWSGPSEDAELVAIGRRFGQPRAAWGRGAAFSDLWDCNVDVLGCIWPPQMEGKSFDASKAALALYNHLAFLTGNDCPRMLRMFQQSGLGWTKHAQSEYHFKRAILTACASQTEWYSGSRVERVSLGEVGAFPRPGDSAPAVQNAGLIPASNAPMSGDARNQTPAGTMVPQSGALPSLEQSPYLTARMAQEHFQGCTYIEDVDRIMDRRGFILSKEQFDNTRKHWSWPMEIDGSKPSKSAWDCFVGNAIWVTPKVRSTYFGPRDTPRSIRTTEDGSQEINSYIPLNIRRVEGDPTPFIQHVQRLLPNDWSLMIETLAARVQFQGVKFMWAPFLQGTKGNGKTLLAKILEYCIGQRYTHWPKADQLDEKYNSMFVGTILVVVDEMEKFPADVEPILNSMVTATRLEIRAMRTDKVMRDVCFNPFFISNDQTSLRCDPDQRRYAPFFCAQQHAADLIRDGLTTDYFIYFRDWLENRDGYAITAHYLQTLSLPEIARPDRTIRAPETTSTMLAHSASRTGAEQEILHAIEQGREGFRNGWISSHAVDMEFARTGRARNLSLNARRQVIDALGYIAHPSLRDGLCMALMPDGQRYRLYIQERHPWAVTGLSAEQVREAYLGAQR